VYDWLHGAQWYRVYHGLPSGAVILLPPRQSGGFPGWLGHGIIYAGFHKCLNSDQIYNLDTGHNPN